MVKWKKLINGITWIGIAYLSYATIGNYYIKKPDVGFLALKSLLILIVFGITLLIYERRQENAMARKTSSTHNKLP